MFHIYLLYNCIDFLKNGQFPISFSLFSSFQYSWQYANVRYKSFASDWIQTTDILVSEATAVSTEPQPHCLTSPNERPGMGLSKKDTNRSNVIQAKALKAH